ncbi:Protein kinase C and casein kinase substrate [Homalodisca vitripennis]|nr:Protein kinase C and casein kinase substrate [Homalodisca vitripennis]
MDVCFARGKKKLSFRITLACSVAGGYFSVQWLSRRASERSLSFLIEVTTSFGGLWILNHKSSNKKVAPVSTQVSTNRTISTESSESKKSEKIENNGTTTTLTNGNGTTTSREANPFEEEEWDEEGGDALVDTGEPGVPVKALYDYEGAESDELSFKQGDLFEKLEDEDEQGWCKGRKDGRVGLYPANYVEPVQ